MKTMRKIINSNKIRNKIKVTLAMIIITMTSMKIKIIDRILQTEIVTKCMAILMVIVIMILVVILIKLLIIVITI